MAELTTRQHGGPRPGELERIGRRPDQVLDFSVNINPYGPLATVAEAIRAAPLHRYPDPDTRMARAALAASWGVQEQEVALGNGAAELLWLLARVLLRPGDRLAVAGPTFSEMAIAARQVGAQVAEVRSRADEEFRVDDDVVSDLVRRTEARALYICAPNNPSGTPLSASRLAALCARHPGVTIVVDQAFLSLSEQHGDASAPRPANAVLVRSLTKDHALPGLRLGAVLASPPLLAALDDERPTWHTGALVQAAAIACASPAAQAFVDESRRRMLADRRAMEAALCARGVRTFTSSTTFILAEVGDAATWRARWLAKHSILVRDCTSFGLPTLIRLGARPARDLGVLLAAWDVEKGAP